MTIKLRRVYGLWFRLHGMAWVDTKTGQRGCSIDVRDSTFDTKTYVGCNRNNNDKVFEVLVKKFLQVCIKCTSLFPLECNCFVSIYIQCSLVDLVNDSLDYPTELHGFRPKYF